MDCSWLTTSTRQKKKITTSTTTLIEIIIKLSKRTWVTMHKFLASYQNWRCKRTNKSKIYTYSNTQNTPKKKSPDFTGIIWLNMVFCVTIHTMWNTGFLPNSAWKWFIRNLKKIGYTYGSSCSRKQSLNHERNMYINIILFNDSPANWSSV